MDTPPLTIRLFGPLRALVRGEPLPRVRTHSVEWLLALLVLHHGRPVERSWLAGTLWLDSAESRALKNLRDDLMRLRKALGPENERIHSPSRDTLTLDLSGADVDIARFDAGIKAGDEASLRSAVALYTGPLLEGCDQDWVFLERQYREQACLTALETLAAFAEQRGAWSEALPRLRRAEAMDGLRDSIQHSLMRVLAADGDAPSALIAYREHRLRLRREMNVEPDVETTRLYHQIRADGKGEDLKMRGEIRKLEPPASPPGAGYNAPAPLPHPITALIGREEAMQEVMRAIAASRLVTLVGTGGVGKTRLCIQAAREAAEAFPHGAAFVTLAPLADPALLPSFVVSALGIGEEGSEAAATPLRSLAGSPCTTFCWCWTTASI